MQKKVIAGIIAVLVFVMSERSLLTAILSTVKAKYHTTSTPAQNCRRCCRRTASKSPMLQ